MRPEQLEAWILSLVDHIAKGEKIEDSRVELKAEWPDPQKAARRIAGHANASSGDEILWVIGLDEAQGVVGVDPIDLADWHVRVHAQFDGITPSVTDLVVPASGMTLTALLFSTVRRPFVVKNPAHGQPGGGPITYEVPWREGTAVRSARREDLIRILIQLQTLKPLCDELEFNLRIADAGRPAKFLDQQFSRLIQEGSLSALRDDVQALVLDAYAVMRSSDQVSESVWKQSGMSHDIVFNEATKHLRQASPRIRGALEQLLKSIGS